MKKSELARAVAKQNKLRTGDAADQVDRAVTRIIRTLRKGNAAHLPGLGTLTPGKPWTFLPDEFAVQQDTVTENAEAGSKCDRGRNSDHR